MVKRSHVRARRCSVGADCERWDDTDAVAYTTGAEVPGSTADEHDGHDGQQLGGELDSSCRLCRHTPPCCDVSAEERAVDERTTGSEPSSRAHDARTVERRRPRRESSQPTGIEPRSVGTRCPRTRAVRVHRGYSCAPTTPHEHTTSVSSRDPANGLLCDNRPVHAVCRFPSARPHVRRREVHPRVRLARHTLSADRAGSSTNRLHSPVRWSTLTAEGAGVTPSLGRGPASSPHCPPLEGDRDL